MMSIWERNRKQMDKIASIVFGRTDLEVALLVGIRKMPEGGMTVFLHRKDVGWRSCRASERKGGTTEPGH